MRKCELRVQLVLLMRQASEHPSGSLLRREVASPSREHEYLLTRALLCHTSHDEYHWTTQLEPCRKADVLFCFA